MFLHHQALFGIQELVGFMREDVTTYKLVAFQRALMLRSNHLVSIPIKRSVSLAHVLKVETPMAPRSTALVVIVSLSAQVAASPFLLLLCRMELKPEGDVIYFVPGYFQPSDRFVYSMRDGMMKPVERLQLFSDGTLVDGSLFSFCWTWQLGRRPTFVSAAQQTADLSGDS